MAGNGPVTTEKTFTTEDGLEVKVRVAGRKMSLEFDLAAKPPPSKSGKSLVHASTGGFFPIVNGLKLSLLVIGKDK